MNDRTIQISRWGVVLCLCVFIAAMIVPAPPMPESPHVDPGYASLLVGYFFNGIILWPAHILFLVGALRCLAGSVRHGVFVSVLAVLAGVFTGGLVVLEQFHKSTLLQYPAFPLWLVSLFMLLVLAVILDLHYTAKKG